MKIPFTKQTIKRGLCRINSPPLVLFPLCIAAAFSLFSYPGFNRYIPGWLLESLPNGICLFALLNCYRLFFSKHSFYQNLLWFTTITILAFASEYLQALQLIPGTFDVLNLLFYEFACIITIYLAFCTHIKTFLTDSY